MKGGTVQAVFLDRDGTLIVDRGFLSDPDGVELLPGVGPALQRLKAAGFLLVVATNQSGIARGYYSTAGFHRVNERMNALLRAEGAELDDIRFCPHGPEDHPDRKPQPGMLIAAAEAHRIDLSASVTIGDKLRDVEAGRAAGCPLNILLGANEAPQPYAAAPHWPAATTLVLEWQEHRNT